MRTRFDEQLRGLLQHIMQMGGFAEEMLRLAMLNLLSEESDGVRQRIDELEQRVNQLQMQIDEEAVAITVQQQPVSADVRLIFTATRCAADVERIADQAFNIAGSTAHYAGWAPCERVDIPIELEHLADAARANFSDALAAFVSRDVQLAKAVLQKEPEIDGLRDAMLRRMLDELGGRRSTSSSAISLLLISRNLERIGDHATNIAEEVIYLVRGDDIRHGASSS